MKNVFLKNWMEGDGRFVFVTGAERPQAAVPVKVEAKVDTAGVAEGEAADAEPSPAELAAKRKEEARAEAARARKAGEKEHREAAEQADEDLPAKLGENADEESPQAEPKAPATAEGVPVGKKTIDLFSGDKDLQSKTQKYIRALAKDAEYHSEEYLRSLTPEQREAMEGLEERVAKLPPEERVQALRGFIESISMAPAHAEKAGEESDEEETDEPAEEGKEKGKEGDAKPTEGALVEAAKAGGFMGMLEKLIEKFGKLFEQIGKWFEKIFDSFTPKFKKSPFNNKEKFDVTSAKEGFDLKADKAGLDATWLGDTKTTVLAVGTNYVIVGNAEQKITYKGIEPSVKKGDLVGPGDKLGVVTRDTLNLQMVGKDGKEEDLTSMLRGFTKEKKESDTANLPEFGVKAPPVKLNENTKLELAKQPGDDKELQIKIDEGEQVYMISDGIIESADENGVKILCKDKTEILIKGIQPDSLLVKPEKGKAFDAGTPLGRMGSGGILAIQILKDGQPLDAYEKLQEFLPVKTGDAVPPAAEASATVASTAAPTTAPAPAKVEAKPEQPTLEQHRLELLQENLKDYIGKATLISATSEFNVKLPFIENGQIVEVPCKISAGNKVEVGGIKYDLELPAGAELTGLEIPELNIQDGRAILTASKFMFSDTAEMSLAQMLETLDALRKGPEALPVQIGGKTATFKKAK